MRSGSASESVSPAGRVASSQDTQTRMRATEDYCCGPTMVNAEFPSCIQLVIGFHISGEPFSNDGDHLELLVENGIIMDTVSQDFARLGLKSMQVRNCCT